MELRMNFRKSIIKDLNRLKTNLKNRKAGGSLLVGNLKKSPIKKGFRLPTKRLPVN